MKMLIQFDLYLWNHFIPKIDADFFERKINSILAMLYISLFKMPRKFLFNYFRGEGKTMFVDTRELVTRNQVVLNKLADAVQTDAEKGKSNGSVVIAQTDISDPNYRYSVGSFHLNYKLQDGLVIVKLSSSYRFRNSTDRITKHLHHWLFTLKNKGKANDYAVEGQNWTIPVKELSSQENQKKAIHGLRGKLFI